MALVLLGTFVLWGRPSVQGQCMWVTENCTLQRLLIQMVHQKAEEDSNDQ